MSTMNVFRLFLMVSSLTAPFSAAGQGDGNPLLNDELPYYPLCGSERVVGRTPWYGCPSVEKIYIGVEFLNGGSDGLLEESYKYIESIFKNYKNHSKRSVDVSLIRLNKSDQKFRVNPEEGAVSLEIKIDFIDGFIVYTALSKRYHRFDFMKLGGGENNFKDWKGKYEKIMEEIVADSIYPDAKK